MTGGDAPRVCPCVGKAVIVTPGRVAGMLGDSDDSESAPPPPPDHHVLRPDLASHVPYRSPRPQVRVRLDANESPWPPPAALPVGLGELAAGHDWHCYGDLDAIRLRARLADWHRHVVEGVWLAAGTLELAVLLAPSQFWPAQRYVLAAVALGLLVYGWLWATDPTALTTQPTPPTPPPPRHGQESLWATEQEAARS